MRWRGVEAGLDRMRMKLLRWRRTCLVVQGSDAGGVQDKGAGDSGRKVCGGCVVDASALEAKVSLGRAEPHWTACSRQK